MTILRFSAFLLLLVAPAVFVSAQIPSTEAPSDVRTQDPLGTHDFLTHTPTGTGSPSETSSEELTATEAHSNTESPSDSDAPSKTEGPSDEASNTYSPTEEASFQDTHYNDYDWFTEAPTEDTDERDRFNGSLWDAAPISFGCASAIPLLTIPTFADGDTRNTQEYGTRGCGRAEGQDSPGVWYSVTGTGGRLVASLCNSNFRSFDTQISVWTDTNRLVERCTNLQCVTGNDDACNLGSRVTWETRAGQEYYIFICKYACALANAIPGRIMSNCYSS